MVRICVWMLGILFKLLEFAFECFKFGFNGYNLDSNASNRFRGVRTGIWMLQISFKKLEFAFECLQSHSNASNLDLTASNLFWIVRICVRMLRILSNDWNLGSNLHSSASNHFRVVRICIWMLWIPVEWLEFTFEHFESLRIVQICIRMPFESLSNGWNLHLNASDPIQVVRICFGMLRIPFKWNEFGFECFESLLNCLN